MFDELRLFFLNQGLLPHGYCLSWSPPLLWTYVLSNAAIGVAYFTIPLILITVIRKHADLRYHRMVKLFAAFILLCGTTHFLHVISVWRPIYWIDAVALVATATISLITAFELRRQIPNLMTIPSPRQLSDVNAKLSNEITTRQAREIELQASEDALRKMTDSLEVKVKERTAQLSKANDHLHLEISDRERLQDELKTVNQKLEESLRRHQARSNEMEDLNKMGDLMQSCISMAELAQVLCNFSVGYLQVPSGGFYQIDSLTGLATLQDSWGLVPESEQSFQSNHCWALRRSQIHPNDALQQKLHCQHISDGNDHICVPLIGNGETLGLLCLRNPGDQHELAFLAGFGKRAALAMATLRTREALFVKTTIDPLTGLHNRRHLDTLLAETRHHSRGTERQVGLMMLDLDHFKAINDNHGHDGGDTVLREFAKLLKASLRSGDTACRYGGEEFVVILNGASLAVTQHIAEQFRKKVAQMEVAHYDNPIRVTISIGIAAFPEHGRDLTAVLQAADTAVYQAKHNGRNQIALATRSDRRIGNSTT